MPTGVVRGAGGVAFVAAKIPLPDGQQWLANARKFVSGLNAMGITAWYDAGGRGVSEKHYEAYKTLADRGELNARAFWTTIRQPGTPAEVDKVIAEIHQHTPFQGNDTFDNATINLGNGSARLAFANSSAQSWNNGALLVVSNWNGSITGGGSDQLKFGSNASAT